MSAFRALLATGTRKWCASNASLVKFDFNLSTSRSKECRCKALLTVTATVKRDFWTKSRTKEKTVEKNAKADELETVYTGLQSRHVRLIKVFSISTSMLGLSCQPLIYTKGVMAGAVTTFTLPVFAAIALFALATPPLLHIITKKYVIDIKYNPKKDTYILSTYNLFAFPREIEFTPDDVTIPTVLGMFTTCAVKGKPIFIDDKSFSHQKHFIRIMGYDKPIDFGIDVNSINLNKQSSKKDND